MAARDMPVACEVKLARRIDARPLPQQGLNADALPERAAIQRLALLWNPLDVEPLLDKVEQVGADRPAGAACFGLVFIDFQLARRTAGL